MYALLDILSESSSNSEVAYISDPERQISASICLHLTRLLNSRQGSLSHLPDYGLPDIAEIYRGLPYSINHLITAITKTIEKFEPRFKRVLVTHQPLDAHDSILYLQIQGHIQGDKKIQFDTYFLSGGEARVSF